MRRNNTGGCSLASMYVVPCAPAHIHTYEHACKHAPTHMQNKTDSTKCWCGCRPNRTPRSITVCVTLKSYQVLYQAKHIHSLWFDNSFRCFFKRNTTYSQNICTRTYEYMWQYLTLLIMIPYWKKNKHMLTVECLHMPWDSHTMEYYYVVKKRTANVHTLLIKLKINSIAS